MARTPQGGPHDEGSPGELPGDGIVTPGMGTRELPGGGGIAADAGEYVLGTLTADERARFELATETDPEARRLAAFWRDRLGPLDDVATPVAPSPELWAAIEANLPVGSPVAANENEVRSLRRSRNGWRAFSMVAALALVGGAFIAANPELRGQLERQFGLPSSLPGTDGRIVAGSGGETYLAVVNTEGKLPAMILRVDAATGKVSLRPLAVARPEGRSLEVWHIAQGGAKAVSIGLLENAGTLAEVSAKPGDTFAVTDEPAGGSPTDAATGPIVYSGQLLREPD